MTIAISAPAQLLRIHLKQGEHQKQYAKVKITARESYEIWLKSPRRPHIPRPEWKATQDAASNHSASHLTPPSNGVFKSNLMLEQQVIAVSYSTYGGLAG
jgi:hypothetical protein